MIMLRQDINWQIGKKIETMEDVIQAKAFWRHCLLAGYEEHYREELKELRKSINEFEKGDDKWQ